RRRHTRSDRDWSSDVSSSDLVGLDRRVHDELTGWIVGDRDATGLGDEPAAFYTCPMDPSVESDHPGPCPICGMALTRVSREDRRSEERRVGKECRLWLTEEW